MGPATEKLRKKGSTDPFAELLTYLPKTDFVVLNRGAGGGDGSQPSSFEVPFDAIADRLRVVPGLPPARFETREFPSTEVLSPLRDAVAKGVS